MTSIDERQLIKIVSDRGLGDAAHARRAILATLQALGARAPAVEREALARALPPKLARTVSVERWRGHGTAEDLYVAVARGERTERGFGREHAQIVLGALGELLPDELASRVARALAPSIAKLLRGVARAGSEPPPYAEAHGPRHHTLATGRAGSAHPLSESRPRAGQNDSVASRNPHGDTKLSSARGETQARERESLADAEPHTERRMSEAHD